MLLLYHIFGLLGRDCDFSFAESGVNQNLISTIEETIQIQKEGRQQRAEAEKALGKIEDDLKNKLIEIMGN